MIGLWLVLFFLAGTAVGSFINVCIDRLPGGGSLVYPRSHCPACQHTLSAKELIPVLSYLWLRGRCRHCGAPIPQRLVWVEVISGVLLAFSYWQFGLSVSFVITAFYCCLFLVILVIDLEHQLILNKVVYPAAVVALIIAVFGSIFGFEPGIKDAAIGGGIGFVLLLLPLLISRGGMGWGDVKLAGLIGLVVGFPLVFVALFLAVVAGGLVAAILLALKVKKRREAISFGPFLSLATMATLFWGSNIMNWYLGFF